MPKVKFRRYKEELQELESKVAANLFKSSNLLLAKMLVLDQELRESFEQNASAEQIEHQLEIFFTLGNPLAERLNDAAFVAHFEDVDTALQLWHAHLHAVYCYAVLYSTGSYRPPFSVKTCRSTLPSTSIGSPLKSVGSCSDAISVSTG